MLREIGLSSREELFSDIPCRLRLSRLLNLGEPLSEMELLKIMKDIASENSNLDEYACFLGAGAYDHYIPSLVGHIISRQEFYTSYTPYQPEISQGMLQAIFEYQTMICELTGMDVSNASMYDGASAMAEAAVMACSAARRNKVLVAKSVHPEYRQVLKTYGHFRGIQIEEVGFKDGLVDLEELENKTGSDTAAVIVQYPNFFGNVEPVRPASEIAHKNKALLVASADPIALGLLEAPGNLGADIVTGEGQGLGNPLSFGGPYLGFFAASESLLRKMPGRIVGQTVDRDGRRAFVLTIQTREQHIRREKATSNICSNQALNALAATVYMAVMGKQGMRKVAELCLQKSHYAYNSLIGTGKFKPAFSAPFFKEFVVKSSVPVKQINEKLLESKIIGGFDLSKDYPELGNGWLVAVTEKRTKKEIDEFVEKAGVL
jgi:glycine dehydrogenase subunit 1